MKPIAIVQHEASVPPGLIGDVLDDVGVDSFVFDAWRETTWPSVEDLGGLIVMGGTMNVDATDDHPFLSSSAALMAEALDQGLPTLGVCLGAQMMATVLGSDVYRAERRNAFFSPLKLTEDGFEDPLLAPFSSGVPVLQFHEDTFPVPDSAVELASSASSRLPQAFRYGESAYAV